MEVILILTVMVAAGVCMTYPLIRACGRRIETRGQRTDQAALSELRDGLRDEFRHLHERLDTLERSDARLVELEERLDFAERVLAQQNRPRIHNPNESEVPT